MPYNDLYVPMPNSPRAMLSRSISAEETTITVEDGAKLPDAPNLLTIGTDEDAETVLMIQKNGNILTVQRGIEPEGGARAWAAGEFIARNFTAKDHADLIAWVVQLKADAVVARSFAATLPATGWQGDGPYTRTVAVAGILATDTPIVDIVLSDDPDTAKSELEAWGLIGKIETSAGAITATCYGDAPAVALNLQIKVVR